MPHEEPPREKPMEDVMPKRAGSCDIFSRVAVDGCDDQIKPAISGKNPWLNMDDHMDINDTSFWRRIA